ncbi:MAG: 4-amino-4-deoxy-L-arabinose transferase and related glycosyltransferase of PMT family-like protein [Microgenomates group bacterium GW2011_GWC1_49_7]|nr:MAG: 4-amino-4-deoxy-L-arabinose transferase and related glycosyltransferase of PMT family-like protein [Microgenomates group bacterium GW2011_GWC1_49_7]
MDVKRLLVSFIIATAISLMVFFVLGDFGITWDEPVYINNADVTVAWLKHPVFAEIDKHFLVDVTDQHPPLRKLLAGVTHEILTNSLRVIDNTRGYRISSLLFVFPFILVFSYIAIGQFGYVIGMVLPFVFSLLPHVFFMTPLLTLDYAVAALWFMAVVFAIKGMKNYVWLTLSGMCVGLTMLTKLNGYLLFLPIGGYWAWYYRALLKKPRWNKEFIGAVSRLLYFIILSFMVYGIGWPWLWTSPIEHLRQYFQLQLAHAQFSAYIFGRIYMPAPWWYLPVMFFATTPAFVLIFFVLGSVYVVRRGSIWDRVILLNALYPIVFFSLPGIYRYDWVRFILPSFPFVCLIAGRGMTVAIAWLRPRIRRVGMIAMLIVWLVTVYASVVRIHPWESSYYNELVGGIAGASRLGFETEYWGNANLGVLPWMNWNKQNMMCVWPEWLPFRYYQAMGQIQAGVVFRATGNACKNLVILMRQSFFGRDPYIAKIVATQKPIYTVSVDGVPLVGVYDIREMKE